MTLRSISWKGILLLLISAIFAFSALNYVGAASTTKVVKKTTTSTTTTKAKLSCKEGSEPNARGTKCNLCEPGNISSNGLSCRACRGDNIAKNKGANSCTPCPMGTKANKGNTACIKQKFVSGERK